MPYFDRQEEIEQTGEPGRLQHWHQDGKLQFVTFRLADSLPQSKVQELSEAKRIFIEKNPLPWSDETQTDYRRLITEGAEKLLDNGYGSCILAKQDVRAILVKTLEYNNGNTYRIVGYVIMPNHVHLIFLPFGQHKTPKILQSIKKNSSRAINQHLKSAGTVWQKESFDRLVRNKQHLENLIEYIRANPMHLPASSFTLYVWPYWEETF